MDKVTPSYEEFVEVHPKVADDDIGRKMVKSMLKGTSPYEASKTAVKGTSKSPETVYQKARRLYELIANFNGNELEDLFADFKRGQPVYIPVLRVNAFRKMLEKDHLVNVDIEKMQKFTLTIPPIEEPTDPEPETLNPDLVVEVPKEESTEEVPEEESPVKEPGDDAPAEEPEVEEGTGELPYEPEEEPKTKAKKKAKKKAKIPL